MVIRIAGATLPANKRIEYSLTYLYGIGLPLAQKILKAIDIDPGKKTEQLTETEANKLRTAIEKQYKVEGELRREVFANIKRLKEIGAYRGLRHSRGLPARGQRTKTNSRTIRGNVRRTMGSGRKSANEKT